MTDEPIIIEAVGVAVSSLAEGQEDLCKAMEAAMSQAVLDAYGEGVTDPDAIRERMLAAQEVASANWGQEPAEN